MPEFELALTFPNHELGDEYGMGIMAPGRYRESLLHFLTVRYREE